MYASDGLPNWYYDTLRNKNSINDIKQSVFEVLDSIKENHLFDPTEPKIDDLSDIEICDLADIDRIFECEVSDFAVEWIDRQKAYESLKKAGVDITSHKEVR